jgi:hypothetical protein
LFFCYFRYITRYLRTLFCALLKAVNPNKANGPDNISCRILKEVAESMSPHLQLIFIKSTSDIPEITKKQNPSTYLDHSQWKMTIFFSLTSTDVLKFIVIPHRKLGVSEPVLVIKMTLLVSENYLSHFPTLIWQSSFRSGTVFIDIGKKLGSWEIF